MRLKLKIPNAITQNSLIAKSGSSWALANGSIHFASVLSSSEQRKPIEGDDQNSLAMVLFQGHTQARAAEAIPDGGGPIDVVNGEVRVGTASSIGFILPLAEGQPSRVAGDLVDIIIR